MDLLSIMVSPINASKAVTDYKLPEKTTTTKFLLIGVTVVNTYHLPANRQSTRSTSSIKGPNFLECSGSFASICKLSSRNVKQLTVKGQL